MKRYWEIVADNLSKAGWSWGYVSAIDSEGANNWIADAHRGDGKRFLVRADEKLTAFVELERATRGLTNWLDRLNFFQLGAVKRTLNQPEDISPLGSSAPSRTRESQNQTQRGKRKEEPLNPLIQSRKTTTLLFVIALRARMLCAFAASVCHGQPMFTPASSSGCTLWKWVTICCTTPGAKIHV